MVMSNIQEETEVYVAFQVIPRKRDGNNFELVDEAIEVVKQANVTYQVSAMETTMKGELGHLLEIVMAAQQRCLDCGAVEVITNIKIHNRKIKTTDTFCTYDRGITPNNAVFVN
jgi:uncharacterized protein YqgV (UPF0045/DUF77 family)